LGDDQPVDHVPATPEVAVQRVGQQPGDRPGPLVGGILDGGDQGDALSVQPPQRVGGPVEPHRGRHRVRWRDRQAKDLRVQQPGGRVSGLEVPGQQPPDRRPPRRLVLLAAGALGCVQAQQIMEAEPARSACRHEVRVGEPLQQPPHLRQRHPGERRGGRGGELRAWHQAEQAEQPARVSGESGIGRVERYPHRSLGITRHLQGPKPGIDP
jgi:hypothetical protein